MALGGLLPEPYTLEVRCFPAEKHGLVEPTLHLYAARARGRGYGDLEVTVEVPPGATKDAGELEVRPKQASPEGAGAEEDG